jgi:hypothetical protein
LSQTPVSKLALLYHVSPYAYLPAICHLLKGPENPFFFLALLCKFIDLYLNGHKSLQPHDFFGSFPLLYGPHSTPPPSHTKFITSNKICMLFFC